MARYEAESGLLSPVDRRRHAADVLLQSIMAQKVPAQLAARILAQQATQRFGDRPWSFRRNERRISGRQPFWNGPPARRYRRKAERQRLDQVAWLVLRAVVGRETEQISFSQAAMLFFSAHKSQALNKFARAEFRHALLKLLLFRF